jgi:[ribosomal protein S5]-alanine N-acetyltransferase
MELNAAVFDRYPILSTSRLTLREIQLQDAEQIFAMRASGRVNRFIARPDMREKEQAAALVKRVNEAYRDKQAIAWAGLLRNSDTIIGTCGFNTIDWPNLRAEIGGELDVHYWGKNIAGEAVEAIVRFGFETFGLHSIEAKVDPKNRGAIYLLEQIGFRKEAHFKDRIYYAGAFRDLAVYSMIH